MTHIWSGHTVQGVRLQFAYSRPAHRRLTISGKVIDDRATVLTLLQAAGITATDDDVDAMAAGYADSRRMMASLYALAGVRYEVPATTFDPRVG